MRRMLPMGGQAVSAKGCDRPTFHSNDLKNMEQEPTRDKNGKNTNLANDLRRRLSFIATIITSSRVHELQGFNPLSITQRNKKTCTKFYVSTFIGIPMWKCGNLVPRPFDLNIWPEVRMRSRRPLLCVNIKNIESGNKRSS